MVIIRVSEYGSHGSPGNYGSHGSHGCHGVPPGKLPACASHGAGQEGTKLYMYANFCRLTTTYTSNLGVPDQCDPELESKFGPSIQMYVLFACMRSYVHLASWCLKI